MRKLAFYLFFFVISLLFSACENSSVNWEPTFNSNHKIPYGTFVLRQELPTLFPDSNILNLQNNPYNTLWENYPLDTYMYINCENNYGEENWNQVLNHVNNGGSAFVSIGENIPVFEETLGVRIVSIPQKRNNLTLEINKQKFVLNKDFQASYFSEFDEEFADVLGYSNVDKAKQVNFLKIYFGEGILFLHTEPYAFTNYYLLRENNMKYTENVFSYMTDQNILWDNFQDNYFQNTQDEKLNDGFFAMLGFILKSPGLRQAFWLLLIVGILFLILNSRRRQAAVPILLPYSNYSLNFAKTLSNLYRNNSDHTALARYKINYFLEQIKVYYHITSKDTEKDFSELLSTKSGVNLKTCKKLVDSLEFIKSENTVSKQDFFTLESQIETFTKKSKNYGRK